MWVLKFNKKEEDAAEVQKKMGNESKTPRLFLIVLFSLAKEDKARV